MTCSPTGSSIVIDKCVVPGVDAADLHLNDESCAAIAVGEDQWKIESTSVAGCGASASFGDEVLKIANTLHIGNSIVEGLVFGKGANVEFTCNYNSKVSVVSNYVSRKGSN